MALLDAQLEASGFPAGLIIAAATDFAQTYNASVQADLQSAINDGVIVKFDVFQILRDIVSGGNGDLNVTDTCVTPNQPPFACRKPDNYLYWDGIHPTRATHDLLAKKALEALGLQ
jgi:phospholipase/lecithinase/hemolysin